MATDDTPPFEILAPAAWTTPVVFSSPHSGNHYPADLLGLTRLSPEALRKSEDCFIDELFMGCLDLGAPLLRAHVPRAYIDLNREAFEFDPRMFVEDLPGYMNTTSPRVAAGLGTIPRMVAEGEPIYTKRLHLRDGLHRVETIYRPFHRALNALVDEAQRKAGCALLIDCHSMPSSAAGPAVVQAASADIVLGDRFGTSCPDEITTFLEQLFAAQGLKTLRNKPYAGGFITQNYGAPARNRFALQVEINRSLYMNEERLEKNAGFGPLQAALEATMSPLLAAMQDFTSQALAAE
jgi:N-formylglutamate amidohydrolase